jgi:urocanate hydratase
MLFYDVNNGIARRAWARNAEALVAIQREMERYPSMKITMPHIADDDLLSAALQ